MSSGLEKLFFTVSLIDRVSKPVAAIDRVIGGMKRRAQTGFSAIQQGAVGLVASGLALRSALSPAIEMDRALGEIRSLGVVESELDRLTAAALKFSVQYGQSAALFVRSSYDIQSAIAGLNNGELARFTEASNLLAAATKSDAATITSYIGTMYGIFQNEAKLVGKSRWVDVLTGQTATAVQLFKTTGAEMSAAFSRLGANAQSAGISLAEQLAVLGRLQATMSGSEAGTRFKAFLAGVGKAQAALGLSFTDTEGRMLPVLQILERLRGRFGAVLDVAESDALKRAFGSRQAVDLIKLLLNDTAGLAANIDQLGQVSGLEQARRMAQAMADPWQQFGSAVDAVRIAFGQSLLPVINPVIQDLAAGGAQLGEWMRLFPNITRVIGYAVLGLLSLAGAVALVTLGAGLSKLVLVGFQGAILVLSGALKILQGLMLLWNGAIWLVNAALLASPVTWLVLGIVALTAAVGALVYWWDDLKRAFLDSSWGQAITGIVRHVIGLFQSLGSSFDWLLEKLSLIPGLDFGTAEVDVKSTATRTDVPAGGVTRQLASAVAGRNTQYGDVTINTLESPGPAQLDEWLALQGN